MPLPIIEIGRHYGHEIVVAQYTDQNGFVANYALECMDCDEVLIDEDVPTKLTKGN